MARPRFESEQGVVVARTAGAARHDVMAALTGSGIPRKVSRDIVYQTARRARTPDEVSLYIRGLVSAVQKLFG